MGVYIRNITKEQFIEDCNAMGVLVITEGISEIDLVRCGECKWWTKQADSIQGRCELLKMYPSSAWYCGNGERRADE